MSRAGRSPASAPEVFGLGQVALDRLLLVPHALGEDEKLEGRSLAVASGGPVASALVALARWGRRTAFAGVVGDDDAGGILARDLRAEGVDLAQLLVRPGTRSQEASIAIDERTGRRQIAWQRPTGAPPNAREVHWPRAKVFLSDGLYEDASLSLARAAPRVVVDAGTLRDGTRALLDHAHVFVASSSFARAFVGGDDPVGACRKIAEHGAEVAGVTLGERGYVVLAGGRLIERPARRVEVVDTTGCGDAFHAAVIEGWLRGWDVERTFELAAWVAAGVATQVGARAGLADRVRLDAWSDGPGGGVARSAGRV